MFPKTIWEAARITFDISIVCVLVMWYLVTGAVFGSIDTNNYLHAILTNPAQLSTRANAFLNMVFDFLKPVIDIKVLLGKNYPEIPDDNNTHIYGAQYDDDDYDRLRSASDAGLSSSNLTSPDLTPMQTPMPSYSPLGEGFTFSLDRSTVSAHHSIPHSSSQSNKRVNGNHQDCTLDDGVLEEKDYEEDEDSEGFDTSDYDEDDDEEENDEGAVVACHELELKKAKDDVSSSKKKQIEVQKLKQEEAEKKKQFELQKLKESERLKQQEFQKVKEEADQRKKIEIQKVKNDRLLEIQKLKQEETERKKQAEVQKLKQEEAENKKQAEVQKLKQEEAERKKQAEVQKLKQEEAERKKQAEVQKLKQEEVERKKQAEVPKLKQEEAERKKQAGIQKLKEEEAERKKQAEELKACEKEIDLQKSENARMVEDIKDKTNVKQKLQQDINMVQEAKNNTSQQNKPKSMKEKEENTRSAKTYEKLGEVSVPAPSSLKPCISPIKVSVNGAESNVVNKVSKPAPTDHPVTSGSSIGGDGVGNGSASASTGVGNVVSTTNSKKNKKNKKKKTGGAAKTA